MTLRVSVARHGSPPLENSAPLQISELCLAFTALLNGCSLIVDTSVPDVPAIVRGTAGVAGTTGTGAAPAAGSHLGPGTAAGGSSTGGVKAASTADVDGTAHAGDVSTGGADAGGGTASGGVPTAGAHSGGATATAGAASSCDIDGPSCAGGLTCADGESCCKSLFVPGGSYDRKGGGYPATVESFCLDKYEVTVGRFKEFIANYDVWRAQGNPRPNAGTHAPGAGSGWQESWNSDPNSDSPLPPSARQLSDRANCADVSLATLGTPKDDGLPINCVSWYEAFAFCIWDGGRLATDAEWEYAAGNGDQHWEYPWGDQPVPDNAHAVFGCMWSGTSSEDCTLDDIAPVGSAKAGDGHWGQSDLAGSIMEWVFDNYAEFYPQPSCDNCVVSCDRCATDCSQSVGTSPCSSRVLRGGSFNRDDSDIAVSAREYAGPTARHAEFGIRCVRTVGGAGS